MTPTLTAPGMTPLLASALVKAQAEVEAAVRRDINPEKGYSFAGVDEIMRVAKAALSGAGLALVPVGGALVDQEHGRTDYVRRFWLVHESGAYLDIPATMPVSWVKGEPDKSVAAADSFGLGYVLRGVLCLPRLDGPAGVKEPDQQERRGQAEIQEDNRRAKSGAAKPLTEKAKARLEESRAVANAGGWVDATDPNAYRAAMRGGLNEAGVGGPMPSLEESGAPFAPGAARCVLGNGCAWPQIGTLCGPHHKIHARRTAQIQDEQDAGYAAPPCAECGSSRDTSLLKQGAKDGLGRTWDEWHCDSCDRPLEANSKTASPAPLSPEGSHEATRPDGAVSSGAPSTESPAPEATPLVSGAGVEDEAPMVQPTPSQVQVVGQIAENVPAPKKRRGRPRGSKNRPKEASA